VAGIRWLGAIEDEIKFLALDHSDASLLPAIRRRLLVGYQGRGSRGRFVDFSSQSPALKSIDHHPLDFNNLLQRRRAAPIHLPAGGF